MKRTEETNENEETEENGTEELVRKLTRMKKLNQMKQMKKEKLINKNKNKKIKQILPKFSSSCKHCLKLFKNSKTYEKHIKEQVCYKSNEITYCKICLITYENHNIYNTHLFSLEHINKIGCDNIEKINEDNKEKKLNTTIHKLDPYLNENDVKKISSHNLGDSFTFIYEKGNTQTITLKPTKSNNKTIINTN